MVAHKVLLLWTSRTNLLVCRGMHALLQAKGISAHGGPPGGPIGRWASQANPSHC